MSPIGKPEQQLELRPATALRIVTPPGIAIATDLLTRPRSIVEPLRIRLRLAWARGGEAANRMESWIDQVAVTLIGPNGPARIQAGEIVTPLRDGDLEHPGDDRYAGRVFSEIGGEVKAIIDARNPEAPRALDPLDPATFELAGPGSVLRAMTYLWATNDGRGGVHAQLTGMIAVRKGAPGWELWQRAAAALS